VNRRFEMNKANDNPFANTTTGSYEPPSWLNPDVEKGGSKYTQVKSDDAVPAGENQSAGTRFVHHLADFLVCSRVLYSLLYLQSYSALNICYTNG
jgi:hypothetical protein